MQSYMHMCIYPQDTCAHLSVRPFVTCWNQEARRTVRQAVRKYPCRDGTPKPYHARAARAVGTSEVGRNTVTAGCTAEAYANRLDFARMAFLFVVKNGACEPAVSATTHFDDGRTDDHACDFSRRVPARAIRPMDISWYCHHLPFRIFSSIYIHLC